MRDKILYIAALVAMLLSAVSCTSEWDEVNTGALDGEKYITLEFKTPGVGVGTRAEVEDNACESFMSHIDVVIYEYDGSSSYTPFHHERINVSATPTGRATISKTKKDFVENAEYRFYIIANSTLPTSAYYKDGKIIDHETFLKLDQTDEIIHLTGVDFDIKNPHYPQMFLMDGVAYMEESEPATAGNIEINDPNTEEDVTIKVTLRRAAAKVQITINPGDKVTFTPELMALSQGYMVRNMPIRTTLAAEGGYPLNENGARPYWKSTTISQTPYFQMSPMKDEDGNVIMDDKGNIANYTLQVTLYCYSHTWKSEDAFERGTSVVLMLPLIYKEEGEEDEPVTYINNYYQLSFSKREGTDDNSYHLIKRNTYYDLRVNLNAPGAEDFNEPEEVKDILYFTAPWEQVNLDVSGESGVKYLKVNKKKLYMYNVADDNTSLYFSSSSPVTITLDGNAYYYNKYNVKTEITGNAGNISASTAEGAVSGNISVHSDIPTNYTIRYFQLKVTNQEGLTEIVDVEQYPLIYITNFLPWYSYRDDYYYRTTGGHSWSGNITRGLASGDLPTTYEYNGDHVVSIERINSVDVDNRTVTYTYMHSIPHHPGRNETLDKATGWTASKVRGKQSGQNYEINYYYFTYSWWSGWSKKEDENCETHNVRSYHVRVMASSNDYTIGRPALDEHGHTARDEENAKLVSPSFVIASRLGAVLSTYSGLNKLTNEEKLVVFADHAKNYVEVDDVKDNKGAPVEVYDNWRLPTEAELKIIMDIQGRSGDNAAAIDFLLNGAYYMSASGPVYNEKHNQDNVTKFDDPWDATDVAIRCVRDVF